MYPLATVDNFLNLLIFTCLFPINHPVVTAAPWPILELAGEPARFTTLLECKEALLDVVSGEERTDLEGLVVQVGCRLQAAGLSRETDACKSAQGEGKGVWGKWCGDPLGRR